jgi:hypothetical protein
MGEGVLVRPDQVLLVNAVCPWMLLMTRSRCLVREKRSDGNLACARDHVLDVGVVPVPEDDYIEVATRVTGSLDRRGCWDASWSVPTVKPAGSSDHDRPAAP